MDYDIFNIHTLKAMSRDLDKEIFKTIEKLNILREQSKTVDCTIASKIITNDTLIRPF